MSRVFDGVEVLFLWACAGRLSMLGARDPPLVANGADREGAVKAGPLGPPAGGALTAPVVQLSPATSEHDRRWRSLVACGWTQRTSPLLNILSGATEMLGDRPFLRDGSHGVFRPQSERAHSNRRPRHRGGGHGARGRVLAVSELARAASMPRQRISPSRSP